MTRPVTYIHPVAELVWYYRDSAAEVGLRASPMEPQAHTAPHDVPGPSAAQLVAARRQKRCRDTLAELCAMHQAAIELAYGRACEQPELVSRYGQGASVALAVGRELRRQQSRLSGLELRAAKASAADAVDAALAVLRAAHEAFVICGRARREHLRTERDEARAAGEARRVVLLNAELGARSTARERAAADLEQLGFTDELREAMREAAKRMKTEET